MTPDKSPVETKMSADSEFEALIMKSVPQPRENFQQALAQQLLREFEQQRTSPLRRHRKLSIRSVALLAVILLIGIGSVFAMSTILQQFTRHDPGLKAIYEQGLGHEIGLIQAIEDFTVTLEWAYADGNRLILAYVIQGKQGTQYTNLASDVYTLQVRESGEQIPLYQGMTTAIDQNGEAIGWGAPPSPIITTNRTLTISTYDLSAIETSGKSALDLQLEVAPYGVTLQHRTQMPDDFFSLKESPEGLFTFDFSVDLIDQLRVFDTPLTATDKGIRVILQHVHVSPSQTRLLVCFIPPDPSRQWTAIPHLTTSRGEVQGGGGVEPFMDGDLACNDYTYQAGMYDYTGQWRLEVTELIGFGSNGGNDQQRIAGSWVFEFVVP